MTRSARGRIDRRFTTLAAAVDSIVSVGARSGCPAKQLCRAHSIRGQKQASGCARAHWAPQTRWTSPGRHSSKLARRSRPPTAFAHIFCTCAVPEGKLPVFQCAADLRPKCGRKPPAAARTTQTLLQFPSPEASVKFIEG